MGFFILKYPKINPIGYIQDQITGFIFSIPNTIWNGIYLSWSLYNKKITLYEEMVDQLCKSDGPRFVNYNLICYISAPGGTTA